MQAIARMPVDEQQKVSEKERCIWGLKRLKKIILSEAFTSLVQNSEMLIFCFLTCDLAAFTSNKLYCLMTDKYEWTACREVIAQGLLCKLKHAVVVFQTKEAIE